MSYISLILPAFHFNCVDKNEIKKRCSNQFNITIDNFELVEFKDGTCNTNYGVIFNESSFCLSSIEDLIYERNCIQSLSAKTFESLEIITKKLNDLESLLNGFGEKEKYENLKKDLLSENNKISQLKDYKLEISESFWKNTEKTLNSIREEFKMMINELEILSKKSESNILSQREENSQNNNSLKPSIGIEIKNKNNNDKEDELMILDDEISDKLREGQ